MPILDEIVAQKKRELAQKKEEQKTADLKVRARSSPPVRGFLAAVAKGGPTGIIAEIKRATPRHGVLRESLEPAVFAQAYAQGGARALSVLTDKTFFKTGWEDLQAARARVDLPILRKDFIIDDYQIYETRVRGADALLLIVRLLARSQLVDYLGLAGELGLDALVEVHSEKELERAAEAGAQGLGVNNRDLDSLEVSLETSVRLRPLVPVGRICVSESGIGSPEDLTLLRHLRFDAALIGEALVTHPSPGERLKELLAPCRGS